MQCQCHLLHCWGKNDREESAHVPCRCRLSLNSFSAWLIESANVEPVNTEGWLHWATQSWCKWLYIININLLLFPAMPVGFILLINCPVASPIGQYISWYGSRKGLLFQDGYEYGSTHLYDRWQCQFFSLWKSIRKNCYPSERVKHVQMPCGREELLNIVEMVRGPWYLKHSK